MIHRLVILILGICRNRSRVLVCDRNVENFCPKSEGKGFLDVDGRMILKSLASG